MKPILFSTEMIKAILDGRKTQTRRVVNPQPAGEVWKNQWGQWGDDYGGGSTWLKPRYNKGDVLYVRETWMHYDNELNTGWLDGEYGYKADYLDSELDYIKCYRTAIWRPSIHMPKAAARIFLRVTDVRVERLQSISEEDAGKEGCAYDYSEHYPIFRSAKEVFADLWDSINAKRGYPWESNYWVWVYGFERVDKPEEREQNG